MGSGDSGAMVNELLIQLQSFDQPRLRTRMRAKFLGWVNGYLPTDRQVTRDRSPSTTTSSLIAATNRGDSLDPRSCVPAGSTGASTSTCRPKPERSDLIDFFLDRKKHHEQLDDPTVRERIAHETFGYTPVMIEHLFDEALLVALRDGPPRDELRRRDGGEVHRGDRAEAAVVVHRHRPRGRRDARGRATRRSPTSSGQNRRLEVLSIIKRRGSLGLLAHSDEEERFTRTRSEIESGIAIALGGLVAEEHVPRRIRHGPGGRPRARDAPWPRSMVGSFGMAGSLISLRRRHPRADRRREPRRARCSPTRRASSGWRTSSTAQQERVQRRPGREPRRPRRAPRRPPRPGRARARRDPRGHREGAREPTPRPPASRYRRAAVVDSLA